MRPRTTTPPRVTIGLPVYNGERFLPAALKSLLSQSYADIEIIVSDNASTDRTWAICEDFAAQDRRIRLLRNAANIGATANYNRLVDSAHGAYFKWAAHDDNCRPDFIAECVAALDAAPSAVLSYPSTVVIDGAGSVITNYRDGLHLPSLDAAERLRTYLKMNFLRQQGMCNPIFGVVRLDALRRTRLIQNFIGSDRILLAHLTLLGGIIELPSYLFERRVHGFTSTMANRRLSKLTQWFSGENTGASRRLPEFDNFLGLRIKQVRSIARAVDELVDEPRLRRRCRRVLFGELVTDPKWLYRDLKYSLGLRPSPSMIMQSLGRREAV